MRNRIITINREFGSGGRTVGRKVAGRLGIPCYDAELLQKLAQESGFAEEYIHEASERTPMSFFAGRYLGSTNEDSLWQAQYKLITELAEKEPCVIVGRCADYILRDRKDVLKVFIHADPQFRAERIVKEYGERTETPEQRIKDKDRKRAAYYRFYTDVKWGNVHNYHIALDSSVLGIDKCAEIVYQLYRSSEE